jgi:S-adenosylmethionine:tRNA ribosyltransferase-isomerase
LPSDPNQVPDPATDNPLPQSAGDWAPGGSDPGPGAFGPGAPDRDAPGPGADSDDSPADADECLSSYDYELPEASIAQVPAEPRHEAKMLVVGPEPTSRHRRVWDLSEELRPGDLLVVNDTRVLKARLRAQRASGGSIEILVLEPWRSEGTAQPEPGAADWLCLLRPAKRVRLGEWLELQGPIAAAPAGAPLKVQVREVDGASGGRIVRFPAGYGKAADLERLLNLYGEVPLPPYIHRSVAQDSQRYQTRYAARPGAVAAPTAGLHLSDALLAALAAGGVTIAPITLHVGLGTFRPLEREDLRQLQLHSEWVEVSADLVAEVEACRTRGGRVIAIGTTSVRCLEAVAALNGGQLRPYQGRVSLVIRPGFRFAVVQGLLTNFHLPRSSLLLLVSALIGRQRLLALYGQAIAAGYGFFSYGDAMLITPEAVLASAKPLGLR